MLKGLGNRRKERMMVMDFLELPTNTAITFPRSRRNTETMISK